MIGSEFGSVMLPLKRKHSYQIFVHDPDFFFLTSNPKSFPGFYIFLSNEDPNSKDYIYLQNVEIVLHKTLNLGKQPCQENPFYSLSSCLRKSVNTQIGCKFPWTITRFDDEEIKNCSTMDQINANIKLYERFAMEELR